MSRVSLSRMVLSSSFFLAHLNHFHSQPFEQFRYNTFQLQHWSVVTIGTGFDTTEDRNVGCHYQFEEKVGDALGLFGGGQKRSQEVPCMHWMFPGNSLLSMSPNVTIERLARSPNRHSKPRSLTLISVVSLTDYV